MTEMTHEQIVEKWRAKFEEWARNRYSWHLHEPEHLTLSTWNGTEYENLTVQGMYLSFCAALDSLEIELPAKMNPSADDDEVRWHSLRNNTIDACRRAIEAQGVKVKL